MNENSRRVVYVKELSDPVYLDVVAKEPSIRVDRLENDSDDATADPVLAVAHAYQLHSGRDVIARNFHVTRDFLKKIPNVLVVSMNGSGADPVDIDACTEAGFIVVNQAGGNREAVAEHAVAMMIALAKRMFLHDRALRSGVGFQPVPKLLGDELIGRTVGIVGLGYVGRRIAEICRLAFFMRVLAYDPYLSREEIALRGAEASSFEDLLRRSDFVSINCPRSAETLNLMNDETFSLMKDSAYFIMTARGGICDETALERALRSGKVAGAGVDVWGKEPPPASHPLLQFDNVIATGHLAGGTVDARRNMAVMGAEQLMGIFKGEYPPRLLNPEAWPLYSQRFEATFGTKPTAAPA